MIISLTGFMGCGKSSVGRKLSELLCCDFADLDAVIEARCGRTIPEIFANDGEAEFRRIEKEVLGELLSDCKTNLVLALGGGAVMTDGSSEMVHEGSVCIYLRAEVDTLLERLSSEVSGRPLLKDSDISSLRSRINDLMSKRAATYQNTAHHIIDTDGKGIDKIAQEIITLFPSKQ